MTITVNQYCQRLEIDLVSPFFHESSHHTADILSNNQIVQRVFFTTRLMTKQVVAFVKPTWISEIRSIDDLRVTVDDSNTSLEATVEGTISTSTCRG